jgi:hypothetical protein
VGDHRPHAGVWQPAAARRPLADLLGRKVTFLTGLTGFAGVSAIGGASVNFTMLVTARACLGAFARRIPWDADIAAGRRRPGQEVTAQAA